MTPESKPADAAAIVALVDAANRFAANYSDDPRQDIRSDVLNAFYAGAKYGDVSRLLRTVDDNSAARAARLGLVQFAPNLTAAQAPDLSQQHTTTVGHMSLHATSADYWKAQAEANAKDAARYRWLRRYGNGIYRDVWNDDEAITLATVEACAARLDAAIDAAMTAKDSHAD